MYLKKRKKDEVKKLELLLNVKRRTAYERVARIFKGQ